MPAEPESTGATPAAEPEAALPAAEPEAAAPAAAAASDAPAVAEPMIPDIAATMTPEAAAAARESTTLMPAWSPPPPPPAAPDPVAQTMAISGTTPPFAAAIPGAGAEAELVIEAGPDAGHTYRAGDHALRLGRSPDNDLILRDPATSGHHARVERRGEQFWIVDLGSTNGTLVNGEPVQEKELNHGDRVTIGQNAVQFSLLGA